MRFLLPAFVPAVLLLLSTSGYGTVEPGEFLLGEMNCIACHAAAPEVAVRLASRQAPRLGAEGVKATPQWLQAFLTDPQGEKPGTLMPDVLHALPAGEKAATAEALIHYLLSLQPQKPSPAVGASRGAILAGSALYHSVGCVQCHAPFELPAEKAQDIAAAGELQKLQQNAVPLGNLAKKYAVSDLADFLRDPLHSRPSGRMPGMKLTDGEARAIAIYLVREQVPAGAIAQLPGVQFEYYEKQLPELPDFSRLTAEASGTTEEISLKLARRKNDFALRFRGTLTIAKAGEYKFYTRSDDGSRLLIDEKVLVENGGIHPAQERSGTVHLAPGEHAFEVVYFDGGGNTELKVEWKPPGGSRGAIPSAVLSHQGQPMRPLGDAPFTVDAVKAARGKELFGEMNCGACHQLDAPGVPAPPLAQLRGRKPAGCLTNHPKPGVPKFTLTDRQRVLLTALLGAQELLTIPLDADDQIHRTMTVLNCYACHQRGRRGGAVGLRREYFLTQGEVDLGDEGRIPPALTGAGAKLRPEWTASVLSEGAAVRPYMATRMPLFGRENIQHLPAVLEQADARADAAPQPDVFAPGMAEAAGKHGRKLVGTGGLSCIACHNFAGNKSLGVPALDLATTGQRLKWDWFRRYVIDPQALRPGTRMPSFWPGGVAVNRDILSGDTEKQIAAIWAYLARKNFTDLPAGLIQGEQEIIVGKEAVIYRHFIDGAGPRAIGVGYPEKANLAFDAQGMRLALLWQGPFIDAARHRTGRGVGFEKPLGTNVIKGPPGPPFARLAERNSPWPSEVGSAAGYHFGGYRLDPLQRPTFHYHFEEIAISDFPEPVPGEVDAKIRRTFRITAPASVKEIFFRAAVADQIEEKNGTFRSGDVRIRIVGAEPFIARIGDQAELRVSVALTDGKATFTEEIEW